eukprot:5495418-Prymnesium_polylepis.2
MGRLTNTLGVIHLPCTSATKSAATLSTQLFRTSSGDSKSPARSGSSLMTAEAISGGSPVA